MQLSISIREEPERRQHGEGKRGSERRVYELKKRRVG